MPSIPEEDVLAALRATPLPNGRSWDRVRFVDADRVERSGRPVVAASLTVLWNEVAESQGYRLRPYGVHQHTLIVGVAPVPTAGLIVEIDAMAAS